MHRLGQVETCDAQDSWNFLITLHLHLCWNPQPNCTIALLCQNRGIRLEIANCIVRLQNRIKSILSIILY